MRWLGIAKAVPAVLAAAMAFQMPATAQTAPSERARLIVLTDIGNEPDDAESMVRLLLYANDIDIEGLVASTSRHLPAHPHPELIADRVAAYGQALGNLRAHDPAYPPAARLSGLIRTGSPLYGMSGVGKGKDTAASRLIVDAVDRADTRPVWISIWGGAADLAQALWTVRAARSPAQLARFVGKLRVYSISDQDDAGPWARANFPGLFWIASVHGFTRYQLATWIGISAPQPGADLAPVSRSWLETNIRKGPLGALYPLPAYLMEGDTPSYLGLIPNGLGVTDRPDWGGWGGRYDRLSGDVGLWTTTIDSAVGIDGNTYATPQASIWRWRDAYQNDFATRILWSVTPAKGDANHPPLVRLNGVDGHAPVEISACSGKKIELSAAGSSDPDGDRLSYRWLWYRDASGLFAPTVTLSRVEGESTTATIGERMNADQFTSAPTVKLHIIVAATDAGAPALTRYRRAIITVPVDGSVAGGGPACAIRVDRPVH